MRLAKILHSQLTYLMLISLVTILSVRTFLDPGIPIEWDHPYHIYETWLMYKYYLSNGHFIGYDPYNHLGIIFIQYNLFYILAAGIALLIKDLILAYKISVILLYLVFVLAIYPLARALGFSKKVSLLATLINATPGPENLDSGAYLGMFHIGVVTFPSATGLGIISLAIILNMFKKGTISLGRTIIAGVLLGFTALMNPAVGVMFLILNLAVITYLVLSKRNVNAKRGFTTLIIMIGFAGAACANILLPYLTYIHEYYPYHYVERTHASDIEGAIKTITTYMFPYPIRLFAIFGFIYLFFKRRKPLYLILTLIVFTACSSPGLISCILPLPGTSPLIKSLEGIIAGSPLCSARQLLLLRTLLTISAAYSFLIVINKLTEVVKSGKNPQRLRKFVYLVYVSLFVFFCLYSSYINADLGYGAFSTTKKINLSSDYSLSQDLFNLADSMKNNLRLNDRALVQDTFGSLGDVYNDGVITGWKSGAFPRYSHAVLLLPIYSNRMIVGGWPGSNYISRKFTMSEAGYLANLTKVGIDAFSKELSSAGVNYIIVHSRGYIKLLNNSMHYTLMEQIGPFHIFKCNSCRPAIYAENGSPVKIIHLSAERLLFKASIKNTSENVVIKLIYYPGFKAKVDDVETPIKTYNVNGLPFMRISLSEGTHLVEVYYDQPSINTIGEILTKLSGVICFVIICLELSNKFKRELIIPKKALSKNLLRKND